MIQILRDHGALLVLSGTDAGDQMCEVRDLTLVYYFLLRTSLNTSVGCIQIQFSRCQAADKMWSFTKRKR